MLASDTSVKPPASRTPRRSPLVKNPAAIITIATRMHSSTSGNGDHGALGASSIRARRSGVTGLRAGGGAGEGSTGAGGASCAVSERLRLRRPMRLRLMGDAGGHVAAEPGPTFHLGGRHPRG